jgi:hypothetical protein
MFCFFESVGKILSILFTIHAKIRVMMDKSAKD